ncbi:guanine nucleotide-binding protein subunit beta-like protein 1 [Mizuhopecten yessoensis]|uniref:guanine nucleotide-binding protein subunit beta-like protein 1 n=1 Tax=Mizuhopecten yessoensis TaxID=6573 RepID=UPI000B45CEE6|nr:guanine nucleotide-binding protein subunit beta-like protein 1 [Mizuhopecten yessoensis]
MGDRSGAPDPIYVLRGSTSPVSSLTFHPSGQLWSGGLNGYVHSWNMVSRRTDSHLDAHHGLSVSWIEFLDSGKMVTQGRDGFVHFWSLQESQLTNTGSLTSNQQGFCAGCVLATDKGHSVLAVPGRETSQVDIVDVPTRKNIGSCVPKSGTKLGMCMALCKTENDSQLVIGYEDGSVALWDIRTFTMVDKCSLYPESIMCVNYNSQVKKGAAGSVDERLVTFSLTSDSKIETGREMKATNPGFNQTLFRRDGKILATGGWDGNVRLFSGKSLKPLAVLTYHKESVQALAFSTDSILACGSKDQHISLWDVYR